MAADAPNRLEAFDGLRAIAALSVFGLHAVYQIAVAQPGDGLGGWWFPWGVHLDVGVSILFAISGFLLYRPFLRATLGDGSRVDVRAYAWRRLVRIVPAYWVALAVITVWIGLDDVKSLGGVLRFGLFAQVYDSRTALAGMGQAWSLNVEMAFYVLLPLFALVLWRARTVRAAVLGCLGFVAVGVLWKVLALGVTDYAASGNAVWLYTLPAHMDALGGGMLLAVLAVAATAGPGGASGARAAAGGCGGTAVVRALAARPWACWGAAAVAFLLIGLIADGGTRTGPPTSDPQYLVTRVLYAVVAVALVLPAALPGDGRGAVRALLRAWPLRAIGVVSYSFYLWHLAVVIQAARWVDGGVSGLGWVVWVAGTFAASLALATASYWLVERPCLRLRSLVPGRGRAATVDAVQAAP